VKEKLEITDALASVPGDQSHQSVRGCIVISSILATLDEALELEEAEMRSEEKSSSTQKAFQAVKGSSMCEWASQ